MHFVLKAEPATTDRPVGLLIDQQVVGCKLYMQAALLWLTGWSCKSQPGVLLEFLSTCSKLF
jgi:hypothetical protein